MQVSATTPTGNVTGAGSTFDVRNADGRHCPVGAGHRADADGAAGDVATTATRRPPPDHPPVPTGVAVAAHLDRSDGSPPTGAQVSHGRATRSSKGTGSATSSWS